MKPSRFAIWVGVLLTSAELAAPSPSFGSTAALRITPPLDPIASPTATFSYRAAPGEANDLVVVVTFKRGLHDPDYGPGGDDRSGFEVHICGSPAVKCSYQAPGVDLFYVPTSSDIQLGDRNDSTLVDAPQVGGVAGVEDLLHPPDGWCLASEPCPEGGGLP